MLQSRTEKILELFSVFHCFLFSIVFCPIDVNPFYLPPQGGKPAAAISTITMTSVVIVPEAPSSAEIIEDGGGAVMSAPPQAVAF
jgi:hypothetical protein